jgi:hypothetical protein
MAMPDVYTLDDLAEKFKRAPATIGPKVRAWRRESGFPDPLPGTRLYPAHLVDAWIALPAAQKKQARAPLAANDDTHPDIAADRARLEARYLGRGPHVATRR